MRFSHRPTTFFVGGALVLLTVAWRHAEQTSTTQRPTPETFNQIAARLDPFVEKQRVIVLTDIANEPDDQMSMVRFLVYANEFDVEGLIAGTSTWMRNKVRPDVIQHVIDAYEEVQPTLSLHAEGFPTAASLRALVTTGQPGYGMERPRYRTAR